MYSDVNKIYDRLDSISATLADHGTKLAEHGRKLDEILGLLRGRS